MTLLAVRPLGLAFLYALAHPRPPAPVYDEPELPREVANWTHTGQWPVGTPPAAYTGGDRRCLPCDVTWSGEEPCFACQRQPTRA